MAVEVPGTFALCVRRYKVTGILKNKIARYKDHMGQKRVKFLKKIVRLNQDVFDFIIHTSHFIDKNFLQRQWQDVD